MSKISAEGYLILEPTFNSSGTSVWRLRIVRYAANKPSLKSKEIAVKVKLNFEANDLIAAIPMVESDVPGFRTPMTELFTDPD